MKSRPQKVHLAALILAIASMASAVLPGIRPRVEPLVTQGPARSCEEDADRVARSALNEARRRQPLSFETNRGQADRDVKFLGRGDGFALLLKPTEAVLSLRNRQQTSGLGTQNATKLSNEASASHLVSMKLDGANSTPLISGEEQQETRANYFIGNDPAKWIRGVETYSRVSYSGVYPGVDLVFYGNQRRLEYDFTVAPGTDPGEIKLRFEGADSLEMSSDGALILRTAAGALRQERPVAYQVCDGSRIGVPSEFERRDDGTIGFQVGSYDRERPLVIDPVLVYSTYLGGSANDICGGIVTDAAGNAYVIGESFSSDFLQPPVSPINSNFFIGKLNRNGLLLTYTFFGGSKNDSATGLAVDASGNVYVCGSTESPDFPAFNSVGLALSGGSDAFVIKMTAPLDQIFYFSLIGGSGTETGVSVAADAAGSAYITGRTSSQDFPTFAAIQPVYGGGDSDAFVSKLAPDGKSLVYSSFLGGGGTEDLAGRSGISVDPSGNAYVAGDTQSANFPTKNALRQTKNGAASTSDGFVAKINPGGSDFVYSTYIGGSDDDSALAIVADQAGNAFVTGRTKSTSFTGSGVTRSATTTTDAFVAKLNAAGSSISYLTFIGGNGGDESGNAIALDASGNAVIAGSAGAGSPTVKAIQSFTRGGTDAFVAKLAPGGAVIFSTYLGGSNDDVALAVAFDGDGAIFVAGFTDSTDFLIFAPLVRDNKGQRDAFIAKIDPNTDSDRPVLLQAVRSGKHLILYGQGFDAGAALRVNDERVKTRGDDPDPTQVLFAKRAAKRIGTGHTVQLQIENANGKRSNLLFFTVP